MRVLSEYDNPVEYYYRMFLAIREWIARRPQRDIGLVEQAQIYNVRHAELRGFLIRLGKSKVPDREVIAIAEGIGFSYSDPNRDQFENDLADALSEQHPPGKLLHQCPCCDYFTLPTRGGLEWCWVCAWRDDGQGLPDVDLLSNPNGITLRDARLNFRKFGACRESNPIFTCSMNERSKYRFEPRNP